MTHVPGTSKTLTMALAALFISVSFAWGSPASPEPQPDSAAGKPTAVETTTPTAVTWQQKSDEGYRQIAAGETSAALDSFEEALQMNPRAAAAKAGKGIVLVRLGKLKEAEELLREALVLNPNPTRTHYELGRIYQQQGDFQRAVMEFKLGIEKFQENHP
jgi:Flp pilus assembly protein TadD